MSANCPTCGRVVPTIFEHVDVACHNWPDRGSETEGTIYRDFELSKHWAAGWQFVHVDYDGPEDNRCGTAPTFVDCLREIDERLDE